MKNFQNIKAAFESQNFNPDDVQMSGVPAHIIEAAKAFINLCVVHDAVNPEFIPNYKKLTQYKYQNYFTMGSPSGSGFSFLGAAWDSYSYVGSRLVSESSDAAVHIADIAIDEYKKMMVYKREVKK